MSSHKQAAIAWGMAAILNFGCALVWAAVGIFPVALIFIPVAGLNAVVASMHYADHKREKRMLTERTQ